MFNNWYPVLGNNLYGMPRYPILPALLEDWYTVLNPRNPRKECDEHQQKISIRKNGKEKEKEKPVQDIQF